MAQVAERIPFIVDVSRYSDVHDLGHERLFWLDDEHALLEEHQFNVEHWGSPLAAIAQTISVTARHIPHSYALSHSDHSKSRSSERLSRHLSADGLEHIAQKVRRILTANADILHQTAFIPEELEKFIKAANELVQGAGYCLNYRGIHLYAPYEPEDTPYWIVSFSTDAPGGERALLGTRIRRMLRQFLKSAAGKAARNKWPDLTADIVRDHSYSQI